jgi:hypothetical protein
MGFRFRKTVRLGGLLRLNFSKSGMSVGVGGPFYNVNFSKRGMRKTMGIPGTGLSYQTFARWPKSTAAAAPTLPPQRGSRAPFWIGIILLVAAVYACSHSPSKPTVTAKSSAPTTFTDKSHPAPLTETAKSNAAPSTQAGNSYAAAFDKPTALLPSTAPSSTEPLSFSEMKELQTLLQAKDFAPGPIDGYFGPLTATAIKSFQQRQGLPVDGNATRELLGRLRQGQ